MTPIELQFTMSSSPYNAEEPTRQTEELAYVIKQAILSKTIVLKNWTATDLATEHTEDRALIERETALVDELATNGDVNFFGGIIGELTAMKEALEGALTSEGILDSGLTGIKTELANILQRIYALETYFSGINAGIQVIGGTLEACLAEYVGEEEEFTPFLKNLSMTQTNGIIDALQDIAANAGVTLDCPSGYLNVFKVNHPEEP